MKLNDSRKGASNQPEDGVIQVVEGHITFREKKGGKGHHFPVYMLRVTGSPNGTPCLFAEDHKLAIGAAQTLNIARYHNIEANPVILGLMTGLDHIVARQVDDAPLLGDDILGELYGDDAAVAVARGLSHVTGLGVNHIIETSYRRIMRKRGG